MRVFLTSAVLFILSSFALAQPPAGSSRIEWRVAPHCPDPTVSVLPGQPSIGLVAFRVHCPDGDRILSAISFRSLPALRLRFDLAKGAALNESSVEPAGTIEISRSQDLPLTPEELHSYQARRALSSGEILRRQDFEARLAWRGGDVIDVVYSSGHVRATARAVALGSGRAGATAQARLIGGQLVSGMVRYTTADHPYLFIAL